MALIILRSLFCMVSLGIAVLIFKSPSMRSAPDWVPWVVLLVMIGIPLAVIVIDVFHKKERLDHHYLCLFWPPHWRLLNVRCGSCIESPSRFVFEFTNTPWLPLILGMLVCYVSTSVLMQTRNDFRFIIPYVEFAKDVRGLRPNVLDASAIIDGRIAELADTGLFQSRFVVPGSVMEDLQQTADAVEKPKRMRGRRGLDVLARLRNTPTIDVEIHGHAGPNS